MRSFSAEPSIQQGHALFELWRRGNWLRRPVVGESFHEEAIRSIVPQAIGDQTTEVQEQALLIPEPSNKHDRNAVMVFVRGQRIGYLSNEDAPLYQPMFLRLLGQRMQPVAPITIWAYEHQVWTGTDRRGRDLFKNQLRASVTVALDEPHMCIPANLPPAVSHALLPFGSAIQVKGEEDHQDKLARYLHPAGEQWAHATLTVVERQTARTSKQLVEVSIDGEVIGELTPAMSAQYQPVIERLQEIGKACVARVIVKGNAVRADIVLHAEKANALDQEWLDTNLQTSFASHQAPMIGRDLAPPSPFAQLEDVSRPTGALGQQHSPIPPRPTKIVFQVPPIWPQPPKGWEPPPGWEPPREWPPAPTGWQFWIIG